MIPKVKPVIGECEAGLPGCLGSNVEVWKTHGNMVMCLVCLEREQTLITQTAAAKKLIEDSRQVDSSAQIKQDIFLAKTVPAVVLRGAINANAEIPDADKEYAYAKECYDRYLQLKAAVSATRAQLVEQETEMRMWQVNVQTSAGRLRTELRNQFKELDSNYQPTPVAKPKPVSVSNKQSRAETRAALKAAADKYGIDQATIQAMSQGLKISIEAAAERYARQLGLIS
jgi:hypothetical protein